MKKISKAILAGIVAMTPVAALAGIDNTHHDMTAMISGNNEKCSYCHAKVLGAGDVSALDFGSVGNFCVIVCHISTSDAYGTKPRVLPQDPGTFYYNEGTNTLTSVAPSLSSEQVLYDGHKMVVTNITIDSDSSVGSVRATNWPHTNEGANMQCTSCHAVHDNTNPPFLNAPFTDFCQKCHPNKYTNLQDTGIGAAFENHPSDFVFSVDRDASYNGSSVGRKTTDTATYMNARTLRYPGGGVQASADPLYRGFETWNASVNDSGTSWALGGHVLQDTAPYLPIGKTIAGEVPGPASLGKGAAAGAASGNKFGCYSCHSAHQNNAASGLDFIAFSNVLTLGRNDAAGGTASEVCYGCHGSNTAPQDPGITGYGHPVQNDAIVNTWTVPMNTTNWTPLAIRYKFASTKTLYGTAGTAVNVPRCVGCHDVHQGEEGLMAFRRLNATQPTSACAYCHDSAETARVADMHHPGSVGTDYVTGAANGMFDTTIAWETVDGNGDLNTGLSCPDCHVGDGSATKRTTAHNWR